MVRRKNVVADRVNTNEPELNCELKTAVDFDTAAGAFIKEKRIRHLSPKTIKWQSDNLHTLRLFLERQQLPATPKKITTKILKEKYVLYILDELKSSPVTVNGHIRTCKAFFRFCAMKV